MAIDDHCGFCVTCGQAALARMRRGKGYLCVWCEQPVVELAPVKKNGPESPIPFHELVILHGFHVTEELSIWHTVGHTYITLAHDDPAWLHYGYSTRESATKAVNRLFRHNKLPVLKHLSTKSSTGLVVPDIDHDPPPPGRVDPDVKPAAGGRRRLTDAQLAHYFELNRQGVSFHKLGNEHWRHHGFKSARSMASSLAHSHRKAQTREPEASPAETHGGRTGAYILGQVDDVAEAA